MISIEIQGNIIYFKASGQLTHQDYEQTIIPTIETMASNHNKFRLMLNALDLEGFEPRALLDDFKLIIKNRHHIERAAIVGNKKWEAILFRIFSPLVKGEAQYFEHNEAKARSWISA